MDSIYEKYNLKQVINASGKVTALGVSKYVDEAIEAQKIAGKNFFEMDQLNVNVGQYVAKLIGAEDAQIVSSAAAGIAQSVAALIGQGSQYHLYNPYSDQIKRRDIIMPKGHNIDFGAPIQTMVELGGGKVVEAGFANKCTPQLLEDMINEDTAAVLYVKSHHSVQKNMLSIEEVVEVSKKHNLPLILDAAAEQDLKKYVRLGVDLVIYSGAKAIEGPSSGLVVGKKKFIEWVRLQSKGIGRAMKVGKENILGLAAAIERYLKNGPETAEQMKERLQPFIDSLNNIKYINAKMVRDPAGRKIYRAQITFDDGFFLSAREVVEKLKENSPVIYVRDYKVNNGIIEFDIRSVNEEEMELIIKRLESIVAI